MSPALTHRLAVSVLLIILSLVIIFHLLVLIGIIPFDIVWGGRLKDRQQMVAFETVSLVLNSVMLFIVSIKAGLIKIPIHITIIRVALWLMFALFVLNTVGNLLSKNQLEQIIFTPLTAILAICCFRLARWA